jgi:lysophospholipid acyltransferase (LPLAT)-like uncharacterized protein
LPAGILPLRTLAGTWRAPGSEDPNILALMQAPRAVVATYHGMFLHLLANAHLPLKHARRPVVLVSPSLDGRLLAAALAHFGIDHVFGAGNSRALGGAREFIGRIKSGDLGVVAADGPSGPCCAAKPGVLEIAALADAQIFLTVTSARYGFTFPSWDRSHLPIPFGRVEIRVQPFTPDTAASLDDRVAAMQSGLLTLARSIASPVLPLSQPG